METLFENSYIRDKNLWKGLYNYFFFRRPAVIACHILTVIALILATIYVVLFGWDNNCISYTILILLMSWHILNYFLQVNAGVKRDREMFDGSPSVKITVTEEYIEHTVSDSVTTQIKFDKIIIGTDA